MPFLMVDGTSIPIQSVGAEQEEDHRQGQIRYSFNGEALCSLRDPKKVWNFQTRPLTNGEELTYNTLLSGFNIRSVSGTGIAGTVLAYVIIGRRQYLQDGIGYQRILEIKIIQQR